VSGKKKEAAQRRKLQLQAIDEKAEKVKEEGLTLKKLRTLYQEAEEREKSLYEDRETISNTIAELARKLCVNDIDILLQELWKKKLDVLILDTVKGQLLSSKEIPEQEKLGKDSLVVRENPVYAGARPAELRPAEPTAPGTYKLKTVGY